jgi:hypothetical protein
MASTRRPAVHYAAGINRLVAPVVRHVVLAVAVDGIALAVHAPLLVRVIVAVTPLLVHEVRRRWHH